MVGIMSSISSKISHIQNATKWSALWVAFLVIYSYTKCNKKRNENLWVDLLLYYNKSFFCKNRKEKEGELRNPLETYNNSHFPHIENYSFTLNDTLKKL